MTDKKTSKPEEKPVHNSRLSVLIALVHTMDKGKPLDSAWIADRHFTSMSPSDRAFVQLLTKTVLRHLGQIDDIISRFLDRPLPESSKIMRVKHILRLGIAQLVWLKTPPHAAVHSSVELTKQIKMEKFSGLVNIVLKRAAKESDAIMEKQSAARLNTPKWLWDSWVMAYGEKIAEQIAAAHMEEPSLDISVKSDPDFWADKLGGKTLPCGSVRLHEAKNITHLQGFNKGQWWVQDIAASIPALLLISFFGDNIKEKQVIDLCAAPGGKTAQLANTGAKVTAVDKSKERISLLKANLNRLKLSAECLNTDALKWSPKFTPDAVLLDAPCSATGTLRRHPDVAWHRNQGDIKRMAEIQKKLLNHTIDMLKSGGIIVYSVCSLQPEEGEQQIDKILLERGDVSLFPVTDSMLCGMKECITKRGEVRTLPCHLSEEGGMDGFYAAIIIKK